MAPPATPLARARHVKYFLRCLQGLPYDYISADVNRLLLVFFAVSGLDLLGELDTLANQREKLIEWIYAQQVLDTDVPGFGPVGGFRGGPSLGTRYTPGGSCCTLPYDYSSISMTYTALATLVILGDDLSRVDRRGIVRMVRSLQQPSGTFAAAPGGTESDVRFLYTACVISYLLNDWDGVDREKAIAFIRSSQRYDFGIAQGPDEESHCGSTFCAIGAAALMDAIPRALIDIDRTRQWLLRRQGCGFQGRPNKAEDACYSFWTGASIALLDMYEAVDRPLLRSFLMECQHNLIGGFGKSPDSLPDLLHSYFAVAGLSLAGEEGLLPMHPALNMSRRAVEHLHRHTAGYQSVTVSGHNQERSTLTQH